MKNKKIIIIGSGVGGLATAVRLLSMGYEVTIFEQSEKIGGKTVNILKNDFTFDKTATIVMLPQNYKEVFEVAGRNLNDYVNIKRIDPIYKVFYDKNHIYTFSSDLVQLEKTIKSINYKDVSGYLNLLSDSFKKYQIANQFFLNKSFLNPISFFNPFLLQKACKLRTLSTTYEYTAKYIQSEYLRQYISYQSMYVGISPFEGPNIYTLIPAVSHLYGLWHFEGGMYSYIKALIKLIIELGGKIYTNKKVEKIIINNGIVKGVQLNNRKVLSNIVVCNADYTYAMKTLVSDKKYRGLFTNEKIAKLDYSCSMFIIYLGLKKKYNQLRIHNLFFQKPFKKNIESAFIGKIPTNPSFYVYCPSSIDDTLAPPNMSCINILVRVPNLLDNNINWNQQTKLQLRNRVIKKLISIEGFEDLEKNIVYENYLTPNDFSTQYNAYGGAAYGLSHTLTQTNYFRPQIKSKTVKNLYFVGDSVHPGTGVAIVLLSSKQVANQIERDS